MEKISNLARSQWHYLRVQMLPLFSRYYMVRYVRATPLRPGFLLYQHVYLGKNCEEAARELSRCTDSISPIPVERTHPRLSFSP